MTNLALGKQPLEGNLWKTRPDDDATTATNGVVTGYKGNEGFIQSEYPCEFTIDLEKSTEIKNIRFLLWDGLGKSNLVEEKNARKYRFSLSVSNDNIIYEIIFSNENDEGDNGWYSFSFSEKKTAKYVKLRGVSNTANKWFHIVEFEVHDDDPPELESKNVHEFDINEYGFKILPEKAELKDYTDDKTHEKLAGMLFNLISKEKEDKTGITVGLEGSWGSGKSTVVNLLYKKIEKVPEILYIYFDAWAHEGDSLRRIFLESFINDAQKKFQDCSKKLEEKKKKVTNREKHTETKTTRTGTKFGILLGLSSLLMPFGLAVVSGLVDQVTFKCTGEEDWIFIIGSFLSFGPFLVVLLKAVIVWIKSGFKEIFNTKNWGFLQSNSSEDITSETSEEEERSSIEFEKYFNEITDVINSKHEKIKIVIVIDNLDRINAEDSLKIWSTLQTFLQRKNPIVPTENNHEDNYDKIWIIVPYDEDGLKKLWKSKEKNTTEKNRKDMCPKSFFDKCFQLRLTVPFMVTSSWQKFFADKMDEALIGWSEKEKKDALNVFCWTRDGINSPSPREIKTFINQLGFLRANTGRDISCRALSYFVVKKNSDDFLTNKEFIYHIFDEKSENKIPEENLKPLLPKFIENELSAILHGVSFEKGGELLLSKMIDEIMTSNDYEELSKIQISYGDTFWTIFDLNIIKMDDDNVEKYCHSIKPFWEEGVKRQKLERFSRRLKTIIKDKEIKYPEKDLMEKYVSFFQIVEKTFFYIKNNTENDDNKEKELKEYKESFVKIGENFFIKFFEETKKPEFDYKYAGEVLTKMFQSVENKKDFSIKWDQVNFDIWLKIIGENKSVLEYVGTKDANIIIDQNIVEQISTKIVANTPIPDIIVELINHCFKIRISKWDKVVDALNNNFSQPANANINSLNLFEKIVDNSKELKEKLKVIMKNQGFWTVALNNKDTFPTYKLSLLAARLFDGDFSQVNFRIVPGRPDPNSFLNEVKNLWHSSNEKAVNDMWKEMNKFDDFSFLWNLVKDTSNKLTGKVIEKALAEKKKEVFCKFNFENNFKPAFLHISEEKIDEFVKYFIENSDIEQQLINIPEIDLSKNSKEIYLLIKHSKNDELLQKVVGDIEKINKEQWIEIFEKNDICESSIVVELFNKERKIALEINYCDALIQIFNNLILSKKEPTEWQIKNLDVLIKVMPTPFRSQFWNEVFETVKNVNFYIPDRIEDIIINGICKKTYLSRDVITIQTAIKKAAVEKKFTILKFFHKLLETDKKNHFVPENDFGKVLDKPLNEIYKEVKNPEYIKAIEYIAEKFNVELGGEEEEEDNEEENSEAEK